MLQDAAEPFYLHPPNDERSRRKKEGRTSVQHPERVQYDHSKSSRDFSNSRNGTRDGYDYSPSTKIDNSEHFHRPKDSSENVKNNRYVSDSYSKTSEERVYPNKSNGHENSVPSRDTTSRHKVNKDSSRTRDSSDRERSEKQSKRRSGSERSDTQRQNRSQSVDRPDHIRFSDQRRQERSEHRRTEKSEQKRKQAFTRSKSHDDFSERKNKRQVEENRKSYSAECEPTEPFYLHTPAQSCSNGYDRIQSLFYEATDQQKSKRSLDNENSRGQHDRGYRQGSEYRQELEHRQHQSETRQHESEYRQHQSEYRHTQDNGHHNEYSRERKSSREYTPERRYSRGYSPETRHSREYSPEKRQSKSNRERSDGRRNGHTTTERTESPKRRAAPPMPLPSIDYDGRTHARDSKREIFFSFIYFCFHYLFFL